MPDRDSLLTWHDGTGPPNWREIGLESCLGRNFDENWFCVIRIRIRQSCQKYVTTWAEAKWYYAPNNGWPENRVTHLLYSGWGLTIWRILATLNSMGLAAVSYVRPLANFWCLFSAPIVSLAARWTQLGLSQFMRPRSLPSKDVFFLPPQAVLSKQAI
jgi:hypothetical protein